MILFVVWYRVENKRRTKYIGNTSNPEWNQTVVYKELNVVDLSYYFLEFTVWDYDKFKENNFLGQVVLSLGGNVPFRNTFLSSIPNHELIVPPFGV